MTSSYEPGDVPGVDRPWWYGDVYYWGSPPNQYAVRVTDPEMMNLPPINLPEASFVNIKDAPWAHDG